MHAQTLIAAAAALTLTVGGSSTPQPLTPTLLTIKEHRVAELVAPSEDTMTFPGDSPGLRLTFRVPVPGGAKLLDLAEPTAVVATDAAGTNLAEVEPGFNGEPDYVEMVQVWEGTPTDFTFTLAPAARTAKTFSLDATIDAIVYEGTVTRTAKIGSDWTAIDGFASPVRARVKKSGTSFGVEMQPGKVKGQIESIALIAGGAEGDSSWSMWDDSTINYQFDSLSGEPDSVRLSIRQGLRTLPLRIHLADQPLP